MGSFLYCNGNTVVFNIESILGPHSFTTKPKPVSHSSKVVKLLANEWTLLMYCITIIVVLCNLSGQKRETRCFWYQILNCEKRICAVLQLLESTEWTRRPWKSGWLGCEQCQWWGVRAGTFLYFWQVEPVDELAQVTRGAGGNFVLFFSPSEWRKGAGGNLFYFFSNGPLETGVELFYIKKSNPQKRVRRVHRP